MPIDSIGRGRAPENIYHIATPETGQVIYGGEKLPDVESVKEKENTQETGERQAEIPEVLQPQKPLEPESVPESSETNKVEKLAESFKQAFTEFVAKITEFYRLSDQQINADALNKLCIARTRLALMLAKENN